MKFQEWLNEWLSSCVKPTLKERTYERYARIVHGNLVPALGGLELNELSAPVLQRYAAGLSEHYAPNTVGGITTVLRGSLQQAVRMGLTERQYSGEILRPKAREKQVECFTLSEQKKLETFLLHSEDPKYLGILLVLYTGLRVGELLALTWGDIDFVHRIISVTKSCHDGWGTGYRKIIEPPKTLTSTRLIPISYRLLPFLTRARRAPQDYVVGGDKLISIRSYQRSFALLLNRLQIPHRGFHALRHTFATRALECGMDVKTLSEVLGHKNPSVTLNRYTHSLMEHKSAMMNKLGNLLK